MACTHKNVRRLGYYNDTGWCKDCGAVKGSETVLWGPNQPDFDWVLPANTQLLQFLRKRLREVTQAGFEKPLLEMSREEMMQVAARGMKVIHRGQADVFVEIIRYLHTELGMNAKHAPFVLQTWNDGVYTYFSKTEMSWVHELGTCSTFQKLTEAEVFISQTFEPSPARDSILIVPLKEALER